MTRYVRGKPIKETHEKMMGSYELHAWRDAMSIAQLLNDTVENDGLSLAAAQSMFESYTEIKVIEYEGKNYEAIHAFIEKTDAQRRAYMRKSVKEVSDLTRIVFLALCIIGVVRAKEVLELRDRFSYVLAPGSGNRFTVAGAYAFSVAVDDIFIYGWPTEVFNAAGISN